MFRKRTVMRAAALAVAALGATLLTALPAGASTSQGFVVHADGNLAGEVWFNSGLHASHHGNPGQGFNSFVLHDMFCGDGWAMGVEWQIGDQTFTHRATGDCDTVQSSYETGQASTIVVPFNWQPFMWNIDGTYPPEYGQLHSDFMGSNSTTGDTDLFTRTTVYNDRLGDDESPHTFTASMWPTAQARLIGAGGVFAMWRDLQERTPLPSSLTSSQRESMFKQLWCHAYFGQLPPAGGDTWDIESGLPNIPWWRVIGGIQQHKCNW